MKSITDYLKNTGCTFSLIMILALVISGCGDDNTAPAERNPEISEINPESGPPGTAVTITGSDFSPTASENEVTFADTEAEVTDASESEINTTVPEDAETGPVRVTVDGNTAPGPTFTIQADAPGINEVNPDSGAVGDAITISGSNFSPNPEEVTITFNGTEAPVNSVAEDELVTEVPEGATDGPIEVTVNEQSTTFDNFNVVDGSDDGNDGSDGDDSQSNTIADFIANSDDLGNLASTLEGTDLETTLGEDGPYTFFALTDDAIDNLSGRFSDDDVLEILTYNTLPSNNENANFEDETTVETLLDGELLYIDGEGNINNQNYNIDSTNTGLSNGTIHIVNVSDNIIEDAFRPDVSSNVFEVAYKRPQTNKFACSCIAGDSGIGQDLENEDVNYTVFAPTTSAFNTYDNNNDVPVEEREDLEEFMNYHIIEGIYNSSDLSDGDTLQTRNGEDVTVSVNGDEIQLEFEGGTATVITSDLEGTNGVVHIIDTVMEYPGS